MIKTAKILFQDEKYKAMNYSWQLLNKSSIGSTELENKLKLKGFQKTSIDYVLKRLKELKYINDYKYAQDKFNYLSGQGRGPEYIKAYLEAKGIDTEIIKQTIDENKLPYEEQKEIIKKLIEKKFKLSYNSKKPKNIKRIENFLLHRGFSPELIQDVLEDF